MSKFTRAKHLVFLKDVFLLGITSFGGPQAHLAIFLEQLVFRKRYLSQDELNELFALCQILPGPSSTQLITAIGYKRGGVALGFATLFVWMMPAVGIMTSLAIVAANFREEGLDMRFARFIQPMGLAIVAVAALRLCQKLNTKTSIWVCVVSTALAIVFRSPYILPMVLILGGISTTYKYNNQEKIPAQKPISIHWGWLIAVFAVFLGLAALGGLTRDLPIRLMENFYRNGLLVFGGGQVLISIMFTEFVEFKGYLTSDEFLTGLSISQAVPGPVFAFTSYVSVLAMKPYGFWGEIFGGLAGTVIFIPGTFLIFFTVRFWEQIKRYRAIRASIEGINAASTGLVVAAIWLLFLPMDKTATDIAILIGTFLLLYFTKLPAYALILSGLLVGFFVR
jgi:chromate transporter